MKEIAIIKEAVEKARRLARESEALAVSLEILIEEDIDPDYEKDTAITEEIATADIEAQDRERAEAYINTITADELKAKAAEAAHAGHGNAIKARLTELGVRKVSDLPEHEFSDFYSFLEILIKESRDA